MKILVTGGAGFIGSWVSNAFLREGHEVVIIDDLSNSSYVYQRGDRKGEFKVHKNFRDVFPIVYSIQKWKSYIKNADFYIK